MPVRRLVLLGFLACARAQVPRDSPHHPHAPGVAGFGANGRRAAKAKHTKAAPTKAADKRAARLGDGCYHVFLDVGSNRGVHGRFFFEPGKYPRSKFAKRFQSILPDTVKRRKTSCVFAFEPNPLHRANQEFGKVPPSISRDGAGPWNDEYWICHAACVFDTPKKPKKITEDQCRNESTFHVYNCQCGDLYNARQRLGV